MHTHPPRRLARGRRLETLVFALLITLPACDKDAPPRADFPNQPEGNPLVPEIGLLPFPSDFWLVPDPTTRTGRRVEIPAAVLPEGVPPEIFSSIDGFSMAPSILAWLPGGVDLASLPDPRDPGATLRDDSPVFLVNADTGERVPVLAELDQTTQEVTEQTLILRPHRKLAPNTPYVVILRNGLRTRAGVPHTAGDAFRYLRDEIPSANDAIEAQREDFVVVNRTLAEQGLDPAEVVLAWVFHTRSEEGVVSAFVDMQRQAWEHPVGDYRWESEWYDDRNNHIYEGVFEAPNWRDASGIVRLDADGLPILQGTAEVGFRLTIPESVDETRPVVLYGHGFFGHWDQSSRGGVNQLCRERRFSTVAADLGFNSDDAPRIVTILAAELGKIDWVVSVNWQNMANFTSLVKLTRERLARDVVEDRGNGPFHPLDPDNIHYSGISNGGTFGFVIAATSPALTRAALHVGGGGLSHFLQRAVQWNEFGALFELIYPDPLDVQMLLSLLQMNIDPIDSINYVHRLVDNRFPGLPPMTAALYMAVNDCQVRNLLTEWVARTAGARLATPSAKDVWGLDPVSADPPEGATDASAVLFVFDEQVEPTPITNVPPAEDNDTHGTMRYLPPLQESWYQLIEYGRLVQFCDGPCDPL